MIPWLISLATSRVARALWRPLAFILGIFGWGYLQERKGKQEAAAKRAAEDAQANEEAHDRINKADTGAGLDDSQRIERLHEFAAKHGNRPPKAGGR